MSSPWGLALDGMGNLYIADRGNHRIRRVDPSGTITTVAGTGERGFGGDGGPATEAQLNNPVRRGARPGGQSLHRGSVQPPCSQGGSRRNHRNGRRQWGLGLQWGRRARYSREAHGRRPLLQLDTTAASMWLTTPTAGSVRCVTEPYPRSPDPGLRLLPTPSRRRTPDSTAPGASQSMGPATCSWPTSSNHVIRRVDPSGVMTTVAGTGERGFGGDGGPATEAQLHNPAGVALDRAGNLYIADEFNERIRRVDPSGTITTVAGTGERGFSGDGGPATEARLYATRKAWRLARQAISTSSTGGITASGGWTRQVSSPRSPAALRGASAATAAPPPRPSCFSHRAWRSAWRGISTSPTAITASGGWTRRAPSRRWPARGSGASAATAAPRRRLGWPSRTAWRLARQAISTSPIRAIAASGGWTRRAPSRRWPARGGGVFGGDGGPAAASSLRPSAIAFDSDGNLYIADAWNHRIRRVRVD